MSAESQQRWLWHAPWSQAVPGDKLAPILLGREKMKSFSSSKKFVGTIWLVEMLRMALGAYERHLQNMEIGEKKLQRIRQTSKFKNKKSND